MHIFIQNTQEDLLIDVTSVEPVVRYVLASEGRKTDEITVHFVTEEKISALHTEFFDDPSPTDCITLPIDVEETEDYNILGEVFICPKTALRFTETHGGDPYEETTLYLVHTLLHLLGYDDLEKAKQAEMRAGEARHLKSLKEQNFLLHP